MRRSLLPLLVALAVALAAPGQAGADVFEPSSLASTSPSEQAVYAHDPAISGDGRYVAFDGYFCGSTGVWRRDLQTGVVEPVAVGEAETPAGDGQLPSISQDGRYVSFTTTAPLNPEADPNVGPDVYVRDMDIPAGAPCESGAPSPQPGAYTLASAVNGELQALTYQTGEPERYGSLAAGRSALSADGRRVAFVTSAISNLAGSQTPALQVAVRDLDTRSTQLASVEYDPSSGSALPGKPVSASAEGRTYGAVYSPGGEAPFFPFSSRAYNMTPAVGASISADGSTVAWMGQDISKQAAMLPLEVRQPPYAEPLWRRLSDPPQSPTRRVTGGSDPTNPQCLASGEQTLPQLPSLADPCQGPFAVEPQLGVWAGRTGDVLPQLSADGQEVAFLASANLVARRANFGISEAPADLYLADMRGGLTRVQALRELTAFAGVNIEDLSEDAPIVDLGISPDGSQVAFTTERTAFPLGSPAFVSFRAAVAGMGELFDIDLADDTLTRVSTGFEGGASEHPHEPSIPGEDPYHLLTDGALSPSFSANGLTLAFSSTASNLAYGDGNTPSSQESTTFDGSDVFVARRRPLLASPTPQEISSAPPSPALQPLWALGMTALSRRDGKVVLDVQLPGSGALRANARASLRIRTVSHARGQGSARRGRVGTTVATRSVAAAGMTARAGGLVALTLGLAPRYRSLAGQRAGESATATVTFSAPHHRTLRQSIEVTFQRRPTPHRAGKQARVRRRR